MLFYLGIFHVRARAENSGGAPQVEFHSMDPAPFRGAGLVIKTTISQQP